MASTREKVIELFSKGATAAVEMYSNVLNDVISDERYEAFNQGVEIGIENTIRALISASVREDKMIDALQKSWGLSREESSQRIGGVKRSIAIERLEEYLLSKGSSKNAVNEFRQEYDVNIRLNHEDSLVDLWNKPEQLYTKLLELGKDPLPKVHLVRKA